MTYVTLPQALWGNGDRHKMRGLLHSIMGRHGHAAGSYLKMVKNYRQSITLQRRFYIGNRKWP